MRRLTTPLMVLALALGSSAFGTTYYLSPTGNDANDGLSAATPWKTFAFALPRLFPSDELVLADGTYDSTNSGYLIANCAAGIRNGTAANPIVVRAANERKAWLRMDGTDHAVQLNQCSYWHLVGLRVSGVDNPSGVQYPILLSGGAHIWVQRLLASQNNRYYNEALLNVFSTANVLVEDSEFYDFHIAGVDLAPASDATLRRLYFNSRGTANIDGGFNLGWPAQGDVGVFTWSYTTNLLIENCVSEGEGYGVASLAGMDPTPSFNTRLLGSVSLGSQNALHVESFGPSDAGMVDGALISNSAFVDFADIGAHIFSSKNVRCSNCTLLAAPGAYAGIWTQELTPIGDRAYSTFVDNTLAINADYGFQFTGPGTWGAQQVNAFDAGTAFNPFPGNFVNATQLDPQLGGCKVYLPAGSPMRGLASDGGNVGANVLYLYDDAGVETTTPLWNPATGQFPCGAIVPGVNDVPDASCFDVNVRLHVGTPDCPLPYALSDAGDGGAGVFALGCDCSQPASNALLACAAALLGLGALRRRSRQGSPGLISS